MSVAIHILRNNYPSAVDNHFICSLLDKDFCAVKKKQQQKYFKIQHEFSDRVPNTEYTRCPVGWLGEAKVSCYWYFLTVGQGLLSLQQVKVEGECFYFFCFFNFIHFPFSPVPLFHLLYYLLSLFSVSLRDDTKWPTRVDVSFNPNNQINHMLPGDKTRTIHRLRTNKNSVSVVRE